MEVRPEVPKEELKFHMTPEQEDVYTAFAESDQDGIALHHSELTAELAELGFVAGLPDVGHLALQVLPGSYSVEGKAWRRNTDHGKAPVDNPLYPTLKAALQVKNVIWDKPEAPRLRARRRGAPRHVSRLGSAGAGG